jgi:crossover junction endodeoxyribonuclease RusA
VTTAPQAAPPTGGAAPLRHLLALPPYMPLINANGRLHLHERARMVKAIRDTARILARHRKIPPMQRAHILYVVHPDTAKRRRDPGNWAPSAKAAVDGLVDAGVLPDDNSTRLLGPDPRLGHPIAGSRLVLHITDLSAMPAEYLALLDPFHQIPETD